MDINQTQTKVSEALRVRCLQFAKHFANREATFRALSDGRDGVTAQDLYSEHIYLQDAGKALCEEIRRLTGSEPWATWSPPEAP